MLHGDLRIVLFDSSLVSRQQVVFTKQHRLTRLLREAFQNRQIAMSPNKVNTK